MRRFTLRTMFIITAAVAVVSAIAVTFRPRDLRREIEMISKSAQSFQDDELVGEYSMPQDRLTINSDGTYNLTISGCSGIDFIENGIWSLDKNLIDFNVRSSPTNSGAPLKWAFASSENGQISLIPDYFTGSYIDRGYSKALSYRRGVANASKIGEDQATD